MRDQLQKVVESGDIVALGRDEDGEERFCFARDMTAQDFRTAASHQPTLRSRIFTSNVAQWMDANADPQARLGDLF